MFKMSMSVSPYSIAQFVNFILKNKKQKVMSYWYVYAMKERDCMIGGCALVKTCVETLILNIVMYML